MSKKNKDYGFPYDYSIKRPLHKFLKGDTEMVFYREGNGYALLQKTSKHQQRVVLNDVAFNNMLGMLDKNGFREIAV